MFNALPDSTPCIYQAGTSTIRRLVLGLLGLHLIIYFFLLASGAALPSPALAMPTCGLGFDTGRRLDFLGKEKSHLHKEEHAHATQQSAR